MYQTRFSPLVRKPKIWISFDAIRSLLGHAHLRGVDNDDEACVHFAGKDVSAASLVKCKRDANIEKKLVSGVYAHVANMIGCTDPGRARLWVALMQPPPIQVLSNAKNIDSPIEACACDDRAELWVGRAHY